MYTGKLVFSQVMEHRTAAVTAARLIARSAHISQEALLDMEAGFIYTISKILGAGERKG